MLNATSFPGSLILSPHAGNEVALNVMVCWLLIQFLRYLLAFRSETFFFIWLICPQGFNMGFYGSSTSFVHFAESKLLVLTKTEACSGKEKA